MIQPLQLHDYQRVAVEHLHRNPRAGLFLDMGLGKTATTLTALRPADLPALVVAPKRVAEHVWSAEVRRWRKDLSLVKVVGNPRQRKTALAQRADIHVIGRDNLKDALALKRGAFRTLILDELSGFKSRQSVRWKTCKRLIGNVQPSNVWGLTGTPSPNGLLDLWAQLYLLDGGERLGSTLTRYRSRYFYPGHQLPSGVITEWILRDGADQRIHEKIEDICLSMSGEGRLTLPPVTFNQIACPLPAAARRTYRQLKDDLVADLDMLGPDVHFSAASAAVLSGKLSQVSAGFLYPDSDEDGLPPSSARFARLHTEKLTAVREIVEGTGSPVLVFYRFKAELAMLKEQFGVDAHTVDEPHVIDRWNRGEIPILLAHPASAGHGLNLQSGGHTICWTTMPWSLEEWGQANKRLARQGQQHPVVIHTLLAPNTVDAAIYRALQEKSSVQDALLAHLESPL